ncbi:exodeoxyribonuclease 1 [Lentinula aciculospora]|uniref:Exodeoxyribonuclease 1 n=1 Tax=Lentinula aciculospora TaxID=153920 RepID=A0A9W9ATE7_9AGAR|nr:exodeoxyribonuclease 1 [Lentinula aciculospora]
MGIQGLLTALKSIQTTKHLSEFSGQIIAVDVYVWLHKGVFTCATELATGRTTLKYVNYAMEKVRLLRHHGIEPYIVFDGGPLPAKKGTEVERKRRRDEHLARGNLLASQGKHSQARECYLKCVDVTPQMAFQLIKALRAESVQYVVAPYEADAQLAFLERQGIVSAILTEDSDLLVFGCKNVLLKFDPVARTVVSISRVDFASVSAASSDSNGISLVGWSDTQFRAMAILSGCDYLPSIPGIGLKTASAMLRKWKTPQAVVKQIALDGKKRVPKGYLDQFRLAEKCFLHQRVYDPSAEKLVYLTDVDLQSWDDSAEAYIGSNLDATLAKKVASGDVDPISLKPMVDINPGFRPPSRVLRDLDNGYSLSAGGAPKGKGKESKPRTGGILSFFGPNPAIPQRVKSPQLKLTMTVGKASGKRTLAEVMDQDVAAKKRKLPSSAPTSPVKSSKFFATSVGSGIKKASLGAAMESRASRSYSRAEKENVASEEIEPAYDGDSLIAQGHVDSDIEEDLQVEAECVEQEDGYISPTPSISRDEDNFSSPIKACQNRPPADYDSSDFGVDPVSSPPAVNSRVPFQRPQRLPHSPSVRHNSLVKVLVPTSSDSIPRKLLVTKSALVDLKDCFGHESSSEIDCSCSDEDSGTPPNPSPLTPDEFVHHAQNRADLSYIDQSEELQQDDPEEKELKDNISRTQIVAAGWRNRWAHDLSPAFLKRRETNITPTGRHRLHPYADEAIRSVSKSGPHSAAHPTRGNVNTTELNSYAENAEIFTQARTQLERFRCS